jgi:hypothetical protein
MRESADRSRLLQVLEEIGRRFRHPGRVYLAGSAALIFEGLRAASVDVDYMAEIDPAWEGEFSRTIHAIKDDLQVNLELASPADFIPLPPGWRERSPWLGRFGTVDVYGFDPYATGLTKLLRGRASDVQDLAALCTQGRIDLDELERQADWLVNQASLSGWHRAGDRSDVRAKLDAGLDRLRRLLAAG